MNIKELENKIKEAAISYYNGSEVMENSEYDLLIEELKKKDPTNPLCENGLAASDNTGRKKYKHHLITGTQSKCKDMNEFKTWFDKHNTEVTVSSKIDGNSVELLYEHGKMTMAISRGDGFEGEDITISANKWNNMPKKIGDFTGSIRGEFLLKESIFRAKYSSIMRNARNATAGIAKRLDGTGSEDISFIAYDIMPNDLSIHNDSEKMTTLKLFGFETPNWIKTSSFEVIAKFRDKINNSRQKEIDYNCDGVVVKENITNWEDLKRKTPTTQTAIKFALDTAISKIIDIEWSMSGTYLTPVAIIEPVELNETTVSRASLANLNKIVELGAEIGSIVKLSKHGEIIPHIDEVIKG